MSNKKATIGATITWTVATIIILLVIIMFIYSSYILAKEKDLIEGVDLKLSSESDAGARETLFAILNTKINGETVRDSIIKDKDYEPSESVKAITGRIKIQGKSFVYFGDRKVVLDNGGLSVK